MKFNDFTNIGLGCLKSLGCVEVKNKGQGIFSTCARLWLHRAVAPRDTQHAVVDCTVLPALTQDLQCTIQVNQVKKCVKPWLIVVF